MSNVHIEFTAFFDKQHKDASREIKRFILDALALYIENPHTTSLSNHALQDKLSSYRSIDITEDVRAVIKVRKAGNTEVTTFHMLGTHKILYGGSRMRKT